MAKQIKQRKKPYIYKGWKAQLFATCSLSPASMPSLIKERFPRFKVYKTTSFAAGLCRLKAKLALNTRRKYKFSTFLRRPTRRAENNDDDAVKEDEEIIFLGSDDTPNDDDLDDEEEVELGEPTKGVPPLARAPLAAVSVRTAVRSPFSGHSVVAPAIHQPGTLVAPPMITYCWNPPHLKTVYTDFGNFMHQFVAYLLPSRVGYNDDSDIRLSMHVYTGGKYYLNLEIKWLETFEKDDGEKFLSFLKKKTLKRKVRKWLDKKNLAEQARAKKEFESSWVMLEMAVKQEIIRMRNSKGITTLRSQTCVKMLIGDAETGVGMVVVDLEQATENEESKPASFERKVEIIRMDMN